jgi:hypothetical protein
MYTVYTYKCMVLANPIYICLPYLTYIHMVLADPGIKACCWVSNMRSQEHQQHCNLGAQQFYDYVCVMTCDRKHLCPATTITARASPAHFARAQECSGCGWAGCRCGHTHTYVGLAKPMYVYTVYIRYFGK